MENGMENVLVSRKMLADRKWKLKMLSHIQSLKFCFACAAQKGAVEKNQK
jgi:hypothetical protein